MLPVATLAERVPPSAGVPRNCLDLHERLIYWDRSEGARLRPGLGKASFWVRRALWLDGKETAAPQLIRYC